MEKEAEGERKEETGEGGGGGMAEEEYLMIFTDLTECRCRGAGVKAMWGHEISTDSESKLIKENPIQPNNLRNERDKTIVKLLCLLVECEQR